MRLILLRHAKSSRPEGIEDHDRPLSGRGREASQRMGAYMASQGLVPDQVLTSTARRTWETWHLALVAFDHGIDCRSELRVYDASPEALLDAIRDTPHKVATLLLVGHNPGMQELAVSLIGDADAADRTDLEHKLPTAGLVVFDFDAADWSGIRPGTGQLERFVTPKSVGDPG